jgi:hypothetical protein
MTNLNAAHKSAGRRMAGRNTFRQNILFALGQAIGRTIKDI